MGGGRLGAGLLELVHVFVVQNENEDIETSIELQVLCSQINVHSEEMEK